MKEVDNIISLRLHIKTQALHSLLYMGRMSQIYVGPVRLPKLSVSFQYALVAMAIPKEKTISYRHL